MRFRSVETPSIIVGLAMLITGMGRGDVAPLGAQQRPDTSSPGDVRNGRYSPLDEINTSNIGTLTLKWSSDLPSSESIAQVTPLVVDGVMYFNAGSRLYAVKAATGETVWTTKVEPDFPGAGRGPMYADGRIYAYGRKVMYAVDAKTGAIVTSFGNKGQRSSRRLATKDVC
jgi:quinoprotein glucose dehydrogenase